MATEETSPRAAAAVKRLQNWAITEGGKIFAWGTPGDMRRCQQFYKGKIPANQIDGWCARLHKLATGQWPGEHGGKNPNGPG